MTKVADLIQAGNDVTRWHTLPTLVPQNLAGHSWGVAMLISRLFNGSHMEKLILIQAALEHDLVESKIGDMPKLGRIAEHKRLEERMAMEMNLLSCGLSKTQELWLSWCDLIEAGLHAKREVELGNLRFRNVIHNVSEYLSRERDTIPPPLIQFCKEEGFLS